MAVSAQKGKGPGSRLDFFLDPGPVSSTIVMVGFLVPTTIDMVNLESPNVAITAIYTATAKVVQHPFSSPMTTLNSQLALAIFIFGVVFNILFHSVAVVFPILIAITVSALTFVGGFSFFRRSRLFAGHTYSLAQEL